MAWSEGFNNKWQDFAEQYQREQQATSAQNYSPVAVKAEQDCPFDLSDIFGEAQEQHLPGS